MQRKVVLDTGPLVAFLNRRDQYHQWAVNQWRLIEPPLLTCEPVVTESCFLLRQIPGGSNSIMQLIEKQVIKIDFVLSDEVSALIQSIKKYSSVPMSLADACLVRMLEISSDSQLLTLDSDFRIYRKNRNQIISVTLPEKFS
ncbi:MAG: PIN domain-containing protein [Cyanobacteria bacterium P01_C01_bin.118]